MFPNNVEHFTPSIEQLEPFRKISCTQVGCGKIFSNESNYQMHLEKHHRLYVPAITGQEDIRKSSCTRLFYCPGNNCAYWYGKEKGKHFKDMKLLRQHYQKVHMAKRYECEECGKAFVTESRLRKHITDACGRVFACQECGWPYETMEALMTHAKRKGHSMTNVITLIKTKENVATECNEGEEEQQQVPENEQVCIENIEGKHEISVQTIDYMDIQASSTPNVIGCCSQMSAGVQTDIASLTSNPIGCSSQMSAGVQTDIFPEIQDANCNQDLNNALDDIHSILRDIETQTEPFLSSASTETNNYLDQILAQSHMYTQTCDDFLSELGLADIQTQTHWPSPQRDDDKLQFTSTSTSTNPCIHDELLVSAETQTSFTQCLLNSCADAGTSTPPVNFGGVYHTQYTQTCDELLLESLDFGGQASDLMEGFQSAYTQT